ncbi:type II toxin-antitoxin system mRNA interferase toxin, RelE/StbE family [Nodularia sp. UHCC 0506]|uniref:type II toxin-antitoxin system RelE/ParE family toxin n=1 Tax=Nodularia sp. UHCC 0506 TaxID=3110243 RepID=UPI002B1F7E3B|nr:type II toxin-antitoxin system mRNA interferase toxin, RelE/StbE family [Nodularia sp. UHCC 0506]MEA5516544.1 type II toxin-antitoxin system mRNA interferase toxin, RelE/StbE family [Nodularia sp. UHCC 0506]
MKLLVWDTSFKRAFKRVIRKNPQLEGKIFEILELLASDIFNPVLKSHKLSGQLEGLWACSVAYDCRIIYTLKQAEDTQEEIIVLVDIGSHDEVY